MFESNFGPTLSGLMGQKAMQQAQMQALGQESQLRQLQMQKSQDDMQQQGQLRDLLPAIMGGGGDPQAMLQKLMATGNPQAMAMAGQLAPLMTAMQKDNKNSWQDGGDKLHQIDAQGRPTGQTIPKGAVQKEMNPSDLSRLITERQQLPPGDPRASIYDNAIRKNSETPAQIVPRIVMPRAEPAPTMTEIVDPTDPGRTLRIDAKTYRGGGMGSPGVVGISGQNVAPLGKALPNAAVKSLASAGTAVEDTIRLSGQFKPGYGNKTILGNMSNTYKRILGDDTGQAQWWQDMDQLQNQTRHELFGSALTATELKAWEKTSISPRMDADQIKSNLSRRQAIEARAASKLARSYTAAGYNKNQINEVLGTAAEFVNAPAPTTQNAITNPKFPGFSIQK